jgi:hypothetical protein
MKTFIAITAVAMACCGCHDDGIVTMVCRDGSRIVVYPSKGTYVETWWSSYRVDDLYVCTNPVSHAPLGEEPAR